MSLSSQDIEELRELEKNATGGAWRWQATGPSKRLILGTYGEIVAENVYNLDAEFICEIRNKANSILSRYKANDIFTDAATQAITNLHNKVELLEEKLLKAKQTLGWYVTNFNTPSFKAATLAKATLEELKEMGEA